MHARRNKLVSGVGVETASSDLTRAGRDPHGVGPYRSKENIAWHREL
jgi:hypothetical protein